jgi:hypothetical protein
VAVVRSDRVPLGPFAAPELQFAVETAQGLTPAAVPTLCFGLRISAPDGRAIRSVLLDVQIQIAARRRGYVEAEQARLGDLFGTPDRWATTLRTLPWLRTTVVVPPFDRSTAIELHVPCTYDLEVTATRYFAELSDGMVPLEFLFSGSVFYAGPGGALQTARIGWNAEADYVLPVATWRAMMDRHYPGGGWLRLGAPALQRLGAYRSARGLLSWDATIETLLADEREP